MRLLLLLLIRVNIHNTTRAYTHTGSARVANLLCHLGLGSPSYSALRKHVRKRSKAKPEKESKSASLSTTTFVDNLQEQGMGTSRVDTENPLHIQNRTAEVEFTSREDQPFSLAQFQTQLRASPLPPLTLDVFQASDADRQRVSQFIEKHMQQALAALLLSNVDVVARQLALPAALHPDTVDCKVCINPGCRNCHREFYGSLKRICDVR